MQLSQLLKEEDLDAYLIRDDSSNPNLYYLTDFEASDPFTLLQTRDKKILLVPQLEYSRAKEEAEVDQVVSASDFEEGDSRDNDEKQLRILKKFFSELGIDKIGVPEDFPLKLAEELRTKFDLRPVKNPAAELRKIKDETEIEKLREAQKTTGKAMKKARQMIEEANTEGGKLVHEEETLTSEKIKKRIKKFLIEEGCYVPHETIVASGKESAKPHATGSGPIKPGEPIVVDIFPRRDRYFGDMTRTFVKGEKPEKLEKMEKAVRAALEKGLETLETSETVTASEVHEEVCETLEQRGFDTLRTGAEEKGFIHSTGHAVGLELHEAPRIADNEDELQPGMVLTIEPGLYDPEVGGVRIEDMILVTENGYENFNSMPRKVFRL